jgi:hypothetical protein
MNREARKCWDDFKRIHRCTPLLRETLRTMNASFRAVAASFRMAPEKLTHQQVQFVHALMCFLKAKRRKLALMLGIIAAAKDFHC